jgi:hypothetical protein
MYRYKNVTDQDQAVVGIGIVPSGGFIESTDPIYSSVLKLEKGSEATTTATPATEDNTTNAAEENLENARA